MALPSGTTGSLSPAFAPARPIGLAVKHPIYLCAQRPIADRAEGTFGLLRYFLGGDRPSQTAQLTLSAARLTGSALELKLAQGGISPTAPPELASRLHSLPPILHRTSLSPISAYSKGSRGLSVTLRVRGIFTTATISPGHWWRQRLLSLRLSCRSELTRQGTSLP